MERTDFLDYLEVTQDEYKGFTLQLKKDCFIQETKEFDEGKILGIISKESGKLTCGMVFENEDVHYYIIEMPSPDERIAAPAVRKITLNDPEEVKILFDFLNQAINKKENSDNGRTIS